MTSKEWELLTKELYAIYGKLIRVNISELNDPMYGDILIGMTNQIGEASVCAEVVTQSYYKEDPNEFLRFNTEMLQIKSEGYAKS